MKEEYVEGIFESPKVNEETMPEQLRGALLQATNTLQQLPVPIREAVANGFKIPLGEYFERLMALNYSVYFSRQEKGSNLYISI